VSLKIRRGDNVEVISGKDSGKTGKVLRVEPKTNRLYVEGLNMIKRHQRPRSLKDTQRGGKVGGVIEKEGPIHASNVMFVDPKQNRPTRIGVERPADGKRVRIARRSETRIED
jgi:large subunit ribosomal protein L24